MKKLISLLLCSAVFCSAFAQRNNHDRRYNDYPVYQKNNDYKYNERARQIQRINNEYNFKINQVNNNWTLKRGQRKHAIKRLEKQRAFEISQVNGHYNNYGYNNGSRDYNRNDRYSHHNNDLNN